MSTIVDADALRSPARRIRRSPRPPGSGLRIGLLGFGGPAGPDRADAPDPGRGEALDRRGAVPARAQLLHAAARPRGAAARDLHRLAAAPDLGRPRRRHAVRAAGLPRHPGPEHALRRCSRARRRSRPCSSASRPPCSRSWSRRCCASAGARSRTGRWWRSPPLAFVAIFFFGVPFPLIVLAAGRHRAGRRPAAAADLFAGRGARRAGGRRCRRLPCSTRQLDHTRPAAGRALRVGRCSGAASGSALPLLLRGDLRRRRASSARSPLFFSKMAVVTFGGAYAVLAYVAQEAVETYGWLQPGEMLDGLAMAETTPGPLIMVLSSSASSPPFATPAASIRCWPARWAPSSPPGSPSCPASCGSSWAPPTSRPCAATRRWAPRCPPSPPPWSA